MKTASYFLALLGLFLFSSLSAQDLIQLRDGETIKAKVLEIGDYISYKKSSNLDGPTYTIDRYTVRQITYRNGEIDYFSTDATIHTEDIDALYDSYLSTNMRDHFEGYRLISREEFLAKLQTNPVAHDYYQKGKKMVLVGGILSGVGLLVMTAGILPRQNETSSRFSSPGFSSFPSSVEKAPRAGVWLGSGIMIGGIVTFSVGASHCDNALNIYNIEQGKSYGVVPVLNSDGIGMALRF